MLDAAGEAFITIFNCLHDMDPKRREEMLYGLGPVEVFNAIVGGETELYRLGTSSYRDHLHAIVMRGIKASGSFEAFLDKAAPHRFGPEALRASGSRALIYLRVVSSFGLLEPVLDQVRDRDRFIDEVIASLGDARQFQRNSAVVIDVLAARAISPTATQFRRSLLDKLYARFRAEEPGTLRSVYGSILSVHQTMSGERRDAKIDQAYPLDDAPFRVPFERLFVSDGKGTFSHRIFMRMHDDTDAETTYANFRNFMAMRGAVLRQDRHFDLYRLSSRGRTVEIYVNKPTALGVRRGIADIAAALRHRRVETVIGRGHTSIITPLRHDSRRVLGAGIKDVATVLVGTCGGDASVPDLIDTFGYRAFFTTRSTGRLVINNAIIETYIAALFSLPQGGRLSLADVLGRSVARFAGRGSDEELRDDASFYRLAMSNVLAAYLFDTHVRRHAEAEWQVARQ